MLEMSEKDLEIYGQLDDIRVKLVLVKDIPRDFNSPALKKITNPYAVEVDVVGLLYCVEEDLRVTGYLEEEAKKHEWRRKLWPKPTREDFLNKALNMLNNLPREIKEDEHLTDEEKEILYEAVEYSATHLRTLMEKAGYKIKKPQ